MANDPLSSATRTAKRNLLVAATVAITYSAFNVAISKIPVGGLAIEFDNRVFGFLLITVLLYFLAIFILYYFIDIRNLEKTKHQSEKESHYKSARSSFWSDHAESVVKRVNKKLPPGVGTNNINSGNQLGKFFLEMQQPHFEEGLVDHLATTMAITVGLVERPPKPRGMPRPITREENPALYEAVEEKFRKALLQYRRKKRVHELMLLPSLYGVRILYFIRNYLVDGAFPFFLALIALAAIFQLIDLHWLREIVPIPRAR